LKTHVKDRVDAGRTICGVKVTKIMTLPVLLHGPTQYHKYVDCGACLRIMGREPKFNHIKPIPVSAEYLEHAAKDNPHFCPKSPDHVHHTDVIEGGRHRDVVAYQLNPEKKRHRWECQIQCDFCGRSGVETILEVDQTWEVPCGTTHEDCGECDSDFPCRGSKQECIRTPSILNEKKVDF
jgi:hypothetical protein